MSHGQMYMDTITIAPHDFRNKKAMPKTPVALPKPVKVPPPPASAKPAKP